MGFVDWNIDIHAHFPNKFEPCSLKITVISSLDYPLVSVMIFIDVAIFSKYATLFGFKKKKKPLIIFSFILHMGFLVPKVPEVVIRKSAAKRIRYRKLWCASST